MITFLFCLIAVTTAGIPIERFAARLGAPGPTPSGLLLRLVTLIPLLSFWLGWFRRPLLAAFAALVTLAVLTAISRRKRQLVGEPLVFSDFGLLRTIVRHPDLYYLGFARDPGFIGGVVTLLAGVAAWSWLEPALLSLPEGLLLCAGVLICIGIVWMLAGYPPVSAALARLCPGPDTETHVGRWGLLATLVVYALRWRGELHEPWPNLPDIGSSLQEPSSFRAPWTGDVVLIQLESFTDPLRSGLGSAPLPGLARARRFADRHGPLSVPTHGAFTMRSEHEVLTGQDGSALFRGFDPYLSERGPAPPSLAATLSGRGYATVFIHPFRETFFNRVGVMRRLGFERLLWEDAFAAEDRRGPYISDRAVAERILAELDASGEARTFVAAVTMENHGPWSPGRLPDLDDPAHQYLSHLTGSDQAIAILLDGLEARGRPALLCLYGDHPPILPALDGSAPPETDYVVIRFPLTPPQAMPNATSLTTHGLGRLLAHIVRPAGEEYRRAPDA